MDVDRRMNPAKVGHRKVWPRNTDAQDIVSATDEKLHPWVWAPAAPPHTPASYLIPVLSLI